MQELSIAGNPGASPFDRIKRTDAEGDYWLARDLQPFLGYAKWQTMEAIVAKARASSINVGHNPADHFTIISKNSCVGGRPSTDIRLSRYAAYLTAMNGDSEKPEVAAAQGYFAIMTRAAELGREVVHQPAIDRPWSVRFREYFQPHYRAVNERYPGCFTVVTTLSAQMLTLEDELIRHLFEPQSSDRPDVSIGKCWAFHREHIGLPPSDKYAPLQLPNRDRPVDLKVYPDHERGICERWFNSTYLPEKLPAYLDHKKEFRDGGPIARASVADHTCKSLTGKPAMIRPPIRKQLEMAGGFARAGTMMALPSGQQAMMLWGD